MHNTDGITTVFTKFRSHPSKVVFVNKIIFSYTLQWNSQHYIVMRKETPTIK